MHINVSGCHVDPNCASETGINTTSAIECCSQPNRRSFRDPITGTCKLCRDLPGNVHNCYYR